MSHKYSSGKHAIAQCDRCNFRYLLKELKRIKIKNTLTQILVCRTCWEPSHPQLRLGDYPVWDPQAVRNPRPDVSYQQSGLDVNGFPASGSRSIQWGWRPVGYAQQFDAALVPNNLVAYSAVGQATTS